MKLACSLLLLLASLVPAAGTSSHPAATRSQALRDLVEEPAPRPAVILLHGANGPDSDFYQQQADYFARHDLQVSVPNYFKTTKSHQATDDNYQAWVDLVRKLVLDLRSGPHQQHRPVFLVGYSLGASVALAAGADGVDVSGIADWYGSLPDSFFYKLKAQPPLLILHGEKDANIPVMNAQQLIRLCELRGFTCTSHIYGGASHGFAGADLKDADERTLAFVDKQTAAYNGN